MLSAELIPAVLRCNLVSRAAARVIIVVSLLLLMLLQPQQTVSNQVQAPSHQHLHTNSTDRLTRCTCRRSAHDQPVAGACGSCRRCDTMWQVKAGATGVKPLVCWAGMYGVQTRGVQQD